MPRNNSNEKNIIATNLIKLATHIPDGKVVTDICDKKWKIGKPVGVGGFGEIYLASDDINGAVGDGAKYVAKIEAHSSGPLFVEMNFYLRAAKHELIDEWVAQSDLEFLGMPFYLGSGSFYHKGERYRFLIIPRYSHDLEKTFIQRGQRFHLKTVLNVALQVMDIFEYIHSKGYVHVDIKASNLLVGLEKYEQDRIFLVDFGLAYKYKVDGIHKEYNPDVRKAHDGTLEFTSRDAHIGAHSRRGDLEVLGYNMLKWLCSKLPWEEDPNVATDPEYVHSQKDGFMTSVPKLMHACFHKYPVPACIEKYFKYVTSLSFEAKPDYEFCRKLFRQGLKEAGYKDDGKLDLHTNPTAVLPKSKKRNAQEEPENLVAAKRKKLVRIPPAQPCRPKNCNTRATRSSPTSPLLRSREPFDWERILQSNPEKKMSKRDSQPNRKRKSSLTNSTPDVRINSRNNKNLDEIRKNRGLDNPTPAMLKVQLAKGIQKSRTPSGQTTPTKRGRSESICVPSGEIFTPAMEEVIKMRSLRPIESPTPPPKRRGRKPKVKRLKKEVVPVIVTKISTPTVPIVKNIVPTVKKTLKGKKKVKLSNKTRRAQRSTTLELRSNRSSESPSSDDEDKKSSKSNNSSADSCSTTTTTGRKLRSRQKTSKSELPSFSPVVHTIMESEEEEPKEKTIKEHRSSRRIQKKEANNNNCVSDHLTKKTQSSLKNNLKFRFDVLMSFSDESPTTTYADSSTESNHHNNNSVVYEPTPPPKEEILASLKSFNIKLRRAGRKRWKIEHNDSEDEHRIVRRIHGGK